MVKRITVYEDRKGKIHRKPEEAVAAELAAVLGDQGKEEGIALGIAKTIIENRQQVEEVLSSLDEFTKESGE